MFDGRGFSETWIGVSILLIWNFSFFLVIESGKFELQPSITLSDPLVRNWIWILLLKKKKTLKKENCKKERNLGRRQAELKRPTTKFMFVILCCKFMSVDPL